ncbi:BglII/BstYI family type II restriction endonuclease [Crenobacter luteus]|uniref:BglII/BstYI family type II restriction endonuclease n=1 Tax=Crenobacter luteus TaxID=1452487 RepID=UPI0009EEBB19|nr:BglII/BstYI family type II restriction endonuclease [Crenobacter luteus]
MNDDIGHTIGFGADNPDEIRKWIPDDIARRYEIHSYRHAATILANSAPAELGEVFTALRNFRLTEEMITASGGNESAIPKAFNALLRPHGWYETRLRGDLLVTQEVHQDFGSRKAVVREEILRKDFLDGHKVDYVKNRVAFDLEWNSKDQTFDRDLYAARAFYECGLISAGILLTRSEQLNPVFARLGVKQKYGASTTWMGKLLYRLNAGRSGGCPMLIFGITPAVIDEGF